MVAQRRGKAFLIGAVVEPEQRSISVELMQVFGSPGEKPEMVWLAVRQLVVDKADATGLRQEGVIVVSPEQVKPLVKFLEKAHGLMDEPDTASVVEKGGEFLGERDYPDGDDSGVN